jgi:putative tryptophan/tyrosine transport system substrate-binding protein
MRVSIAGLTAVVIVALALAALGAEAQPPRVARVGIIASGSSTTAAPWIDAFRRRLHDLGYVEGRNVAIEVRYAGAALDLATGTQRYRDLSAELVGLRPDVIVTWGTGISRAAKETTSTIPIVMVGAGEPIANGLVKSLARPGGNVTGQSLMGPELALKGFDLLTEAAPRVKHIAALYNPEILVNPVGMRALAPLAKARGIAFQTMAIRAPDDLARALESAGGTRPHALLVVAVNVAQLGRIVEIAAKYRLPAVYGFREAADAGGLMSYGPKLPDLWRGAANYVERILKGAKPGDLPVEQPTTLELVINLRTAKALGLAIPAPLRARADDIIE